MPRALSSIAPSAAPFGQLVDLEDEQAHLFFDSAQACNQP
jgi:hypothetical protein